MAGNNNTLTNPLEDKSMDTKRIALLLAVGIALLGLTGCAHEIRFENLDYTIEARKADAGLVAVIDQKTLDHVVTIRSAATGIAHRWNAEPGAMLKQVADIELPQLVTSYSSSTSFGEPSQGKRRITLVLTVPNYEFSDWRAKYSVKAVAYGPNRTPLFDKTYSEEGSNQKGKMIGAGAFGMKSAVRQSSLEALKRIFAQIRGDLGKSLEGK